MKKFALDKGQRFKSRFNVSQKQKSKLIVSEESYDSEIEGLPDISEEEKEEMYSSLEEIDEVIPKEDARKFP